MSINVYFKQGPYEIARIKGQRDLRQFSGLRHVIMVTGGPMMGRSIATRSRAAAEGIVKSADARRQKRRAQRRAQRRARRIARRHRG